MIKVMTELNEFLPRLFMGLGAIFSGIILLVCIQQYKKKFIHSKLIEIDENDEKS